MDRARGRKVGRDWSKDSTRLGGALLLINRILQEGVLAKGMLAGNNRN